jgi:hypothetical protein
LKKENVDLNLFEPHIEILQIEEKDKYVSGSNYNKKIWDLSKADNVLIVHPDSTEFICEKIL